MSDCDGFGIVIVSAFCEAACRSCRGVSPSAASPRLSEAAVLPGGSAVADITAAMRSAFVVCAKKPMTVSTEEARSIRPFSKAPAANCPSTRRLAAMGIGDSVTSNIARSLLCDANATGLIATAA